MKNLFYLCYSGIWVEVTDKKLSTPKKEIYFGAKKGVKIQFWFYFCVENRVVMLLAHL